jgi:hypothetical protein
MLIKGAVLCWICQKPISEDEGRLDEFNFPVHRKCFALSAEEKRKIREPEAKKS